MAAVASSARETPARRLTPASVAPGDLPARGRHRKTLSMSMERVARGDWITKVEFHERLGRWYRETDDAVIGDPGTDRRTTWLWVRDGHRLARLFADTTREAVGQYLDLLRRLHGAIDWHVVPSAAGQNTKIAFGPDRVVFDGFHLYVDPSTVPPRAR